MLFEEYTYFNYQFPEPQYLGAKHTHLVWLNKFIPKNINKTLDAFGGSQSVAYLLKQCGFEVLTNDFLEFNNQIGKALIENRDTKLNQSDIDFLFSKNSNLSAYHLMTDTYSNLFFETSETLFVDNLRANIDHIANPFKKALAFSIINRAMTRKVTMGHFGHTQALNYANDPARVKRNRSLIRPLKDIFLELLPKYNASIFDNKNENKSFNANILDLLPQFSDIDLVYFDPPYCDSHADYQSFYHLLETYTVYWKDKQFINGIKRYEPQRYSGFDKKKTVIQSFEQLFEAASDIPHWLISYNDRSFPSIEELSKMVSKYKDVTVETKVYQNGRGGKGSVAGSNEVLLVCKPKKKFHFNIKSTPELVAYEGF
jgi:adenine-specific DNA-methyltransferase